LTLESATPTLAAPPDPAKRLAPEGPRNDNDTEPGASGLVNPSARYNITKAWYASAQIQNLFNQDHELAYPYDTPRCGVDPALDRQPLAWACRAEPSCRLTLRP